MRETQERVDDGFERVFANTAVKDGTTISEYMSCFLQKEVNNAKFPKLTKRMNYLKHEEGGVDAVCEVMKKYSEKAVKEANIIAIKNMLEFGVPKANILQKYNESEYNAAIAELQTKPVSAKCKN